MMDANGHEPQREEVYNDDLVDSIFEELRWQPFPEGQGSVHAIIRDVLGSVAFKLWLEEVKSKALSESNR